ncbi:hypothetical protein F946_01133 [Acinetobacter johnsonii ANC 3681]|uniref:Uncharacterized protein n=1 Tax=Acinetobacter johnsonii ANC 3681 TaxID=1217662 RepID=N9BKF3_ACIJO|nr:hypothetical protein [Acinetobacter johnsonii]ENV73621.1 hypothetical protein F946_01133 [Acinetobacter johnsonii ANC 3681]
MKKTIVIISAVLALIIVACVAFYLGKSSDQNDGKNAKKDLIPYVISRDGRLVVYGFNYDPTKSKSEQEKNSKLIVELKEIDLVVDCTDPNLIKDEKSSTSNCQAGYKLKMKGSLGVDSIEFLDKDGKVIFDGATELSPELKALMTLSLANQIKEEQAAQDQTSKNEKVVETPKNEKVIESTKDESSNYGDLLFSDNSKQLSLYKNSKGYTIVSKSLSKGAVNCGTVSGVRASGGIEISCEDDKFTFIQIDPDGQYFLSNDSGLDLQGKFPNYDDSKIDF